MRGRDREDDDGPVPSSATLSRSRRSYGRTVPVNPPARAIRQNTTTTEIPRHARDDRPRSTGVAMRNVAAWANSGKVYTMNLHFEETIRRNMRKTPEERVETLMAALREVEARGLWPKIDRKAKERRILTSLRANSSKH
jgi:hypothetical protein